MVIGLKKMTGIMNMTTKNRRSNIALRAVAMILLMWNMQASATTITWNGAHNSNWSTGTNWTPSGPPTAGQDVVMTAGTNKTPIDNLGTSLSLNSLTIGGSITSFTVNSNSVLTAATGSFTGGIGVTATAGTLNITGALTNSDNITTGLTGVVTLSGNVTNTGGTLTSGATGTSFTIGSAATVTGGTIVGVMTNNGTFSGVTYSGATINGGHIAGTSTASGADVFSSAVTQSSGSLSAAAAGTISWNGGANGGTLSAGSGTLNILASTTNTGGTINGGTYTSGVTITNGAVSGTSTLSGSATFSGVTNSTTLNASAGAVTFTGGTNSGTLTTSGSGTLTVTGTVANGSGTINNALFTGASLTGGSISGTNTATGTNTFAGSIANTGTLTINSGTTTISGTITDTGATAITVNGAVLNIASTGDIDPLATFTENTGGTVTLSGTLDVSTANLLGGSIDGTGSFGGGTVDNGNGTNGTNADGVNLYVGGSNAAGNTAATADYTFGTYNQDSGGTLSLNFNSGATSNDQLDTTVGSNINGTLNLFQGGAELNTSALNTADDYILLINEVGSGDVIGTFSTVNVLGLAGTNSGTPGATSGWWLVYNGTDAGGDGDVELDYVAPSGGAPEPSTDVLLGAALVGLALVRRKLVKR